VLLFLVLDLAVESGATAVNSDVHVGTTIGVVLAMITFVHAFTEALVIAGHYIIDTWEGHFLAKQFIFKKFSEVAVDWIFFFFFLFCPLMVMCVTLFMQSDNWWSITGTYQVIFLKELCTTMCIISSGAINRASLSLLFFQLLRGLHSYWHFTYYSASMWYTMKLKLPGNSARIAVTLTVITGNMF
jgi:hypothetical protein